MSAATAFDRFLQVLNRNAPAARRSFRPPLTADEETDLWLNWRGDLPDEVAEVLRIANGQEGVLTGPIWEYVMLRHEDICYRKNLYEFYFSPADVPLFEDGNGGFVFWRDGRIKVSEPSGAIVRELPSLTALFDFFSERLVSGSDWIEQRGEDELPFFVWVNE